MNDAGYRAWDVKRCVLHGALWVLVIVALTMLLVLVRARLDKAHIALLYLMVVLVASAREGRTFGVAAALVTFLCFDFFLLPPYYTFVVAQPLDWLVLLTYLLTAGVAAQLFHRAQNEAEAARQRTSDIERLSALGSETLNMGRAEDALGAVASVIRTTLKVNRVEVYLKHPGTEEPRLAVRSPRERAELIESEAPRLVVWVAREGLAAAQLMDGTVKLQEAARPPGVVAQAFDPVNARVLLLPLRMRDRTVGVLRLVADEPISLQSHQRQFVDVLSYYAALGVERVRLTAAAEHASALAEADRLKDALLAAVSHDLRTPLTTIRAIAHEVADSGDARGGAIEAEANRLNDIVADLLDLSKLQGNAVRIKPQVNAAEDLIGAALQHLGAVLGERTVRVTVEPPDLAGRFDFVHSMRVLVNLIENAHKYSPAEQPIDIAARRDGDALVVSVADRGPGIPNAERHLIYQPFYRSKSVAKDVGGTGLGLTIANRLAELQGGVLRHIARAGGGTVFVYRVPAAALPEATNLAQTAAD